MGLDDDFKAAADKVRNWTKRPTENNDGLNVYSLYKQAVAGDVNVGEPSGEVEKYKWQAWTGRKGLSQEDAKKQYIALINEIHSKYA